MTIAALLLASVLGSVHCAAMCGGIAYAAGGMDPAGRLWYHLGRLTVYVGLGLAAGAGGALVDSAGERLGWAQAATTIAGWALVGFGLLALLRTLGVRLPGRRGLVEPSVRRLFLRIRAVPPRWRGAALGGATGLLPCGWLYAFVAVAAGTGSALQGGGAMAVFWLGTVPWVAAASLALQRLGGRFGARLPAFGAALVIGIGLLTALGRLSPHQAASATSTVSSHAAGGH